MRQKRRSYRGSDDDEDVGGDDLAAVNQRLDALTRQLERVAHANAPPRTGADGTDERADRVSEALARLDRRLDQVIHEGRVVQSEFQQRARHAPPPPPAPQFAASLPPQFAPPPPPAPSRGPANWAAQISARQRALDGGPAAPAASPAAAPANWSAGPDLSGLEQQLYHTNTQISSLHQPYENALGALRNDLADIGRALTDAMPRRAIEALETEVRALADRVDRTRQAGAALGSLERELAEVRNALRSLTPAENLAGFEEAVRGLYQKIDQLVASGQAPHGDPVAFKQLEQAVVSLRGVVSNVASDGVLAQLAAEVRGLGAQFERATADSNTKALAKLEARIASLMEGGRAVPPELEGSIRALSERLDRMQLSQGDQLALGALEDRIAKLSEKLDASDSRLGHLEAIERGLADLLVYLEEMRSGGGPRGLRAPPTEPAPAPAAPPRPAPEALAAAPTPALARSPLDLLLELPQHAAPSIQHAPEPAPIPPQIEAFAPPPAPMAPGPRPQPPARQLPRGPQRQPIDPNLPPDTPLEPGSGAPRIKPGSAAARIAASEAALGNARPAIAENGGKSASITAARNAAKAAYLDTPVKVPKTRSGKPNEWLKWPHKKAAKDVPPEPQFHAPAPVLPPMPAHAPAPTPVQIPSAMPPQMHVDDGLTGQPVSRGRKILKDLKTLLIAASVAIIVVGVAQTAMEFLFPDSPPAAPGAPIKDQSKAPSAIKLPDVTGSISRKPAPPRPPAPDNTPSASTNTDSLPASISPALRSAAAANDPAAEYELGARYAEGRGVPQNLPEAVRWLERAAGAGFAPAQFRLASFNEKGEGLKKDVHAARRLYIAAAAKGHAKAMHHLAVLHAEGIDGKPDYKTAAEWFRRAAEFGIADSQYNLGILLARGIGMEQNLPESYKWFALAAIQGDQDAAKKRDDVGAKLDTASLASARAAVQSFTAQPQPEDAISVQTPPGGWDKPAAENTPVKKPRTGSVARLSAS